MQHEYEFSKFVDLKRLQMDDDNFVSMRIDTVIKHLGIEILNNDKSFIAETFYEKAVICYVDRGQKDISICCNNYYILDEEAQNQRNIVLAPLKSKNSLTNLELIQQKGRSKHYTMEIVMKPTGDKSFILTLEKVKFFLRPYLLKKLLAFFTESMPDYDYSLDKPNGYYKRNGELESKDPNNKMTFILDVKNSVFIFTNDLHNEKVVVWDGHLNLNFHRENFNDCKELLKRKYHKEYRKEKMMNSFVSIEDFTPPEDIQMPVGYLTINLLDACFKMCKITNIRENKKRLMSPCNLFFSSKSMMEMLENKFLINNEQNINVDKTFLKFTMKDIAIINDVVQYFMRDLKKFNEELDSKSNMRDSVMVAEINKDLDFARTTQFKMTHVGENKMGEISIDTSKTPRLKTSHRKISDLPVDINNTLMNTLLGAPRKATEDELVHNITGVFANPDDDIYQSKVIVRHNSHSELIRKEE